jgi:hypothetical protein
MFSKKKLNSTKLKNFAKNKKSKRNITNRSFQEADNITETLLRVHLNLITAAMSPELEQETETQPLEASTPSQGFTDNLNLFIIFILSRLSLS